MTGKKYRWHQFRLRFLVIAIPLGGLVLGWPWAELQRLHRDAEFGRQLRLLNVFNMDSVDDRKLMKKIVARELPLGRLPGRVIRMLSRDRRSLCIFTNTPGPYLFRVSEDRRIVGAISLHHDWQTGEPPRVPAEVLRLRDFLAANSAQLFELRESKIADLLEDQGFGMADLAKVPNSATLLSMRLAGGFALTLQAANRITARGVELRPPQPVFWCIYPDDTPLVGPAAP